MNDEKIMESEGILRMPKIRGKVFSCKCGKISGEVLDYSNAYKESSNKEKKKLLKVFEEMKNGEYRCTSCNTKVKYRDIEKVLGSKMAMVSESNKISEEKKASLSDIINTLNLLIEVYTWKMATYSEIRPGECFAYNGSVYIKVETNKASECTSAINIENGERFRTRIEQTYKMFGKKDKITKEFINNLVVLKVEMRKVVEDN